jgi:hypothetical protein
MFLYASNWRCEDERERGGRKGEMFIFFVETKKAAVIIKGRWREVHISMVFPTLFQVLIHQNIILFTHAKQFKLVAIMF